MALSLALSGDSIIQRRLLSHTDPVLRPLFDLVRDADITFTNIGVLANDDRGDPALDCGGSHARRPCYHARPNGTGALKRTSRSWARVAWTVCASRPSIWRNLG